MPGLASLTKSLFNRIGERRAQCAILELDDEDKPATGDYMAFQYFPETISDTKQVNYQTREIPGGSLPLYQWISSGERVISFQAFFTTDVDLLQDPKIFSKIVSKGYVRRNVDPRIAVLMLRRFMLPRYSKDAKQLGVPLTTAPRKLILRVQNSGIGLSGGAVQATGQGAPSALAVAESDISDTILHDSIPVIMTQCDVTYQAFFPSGIPRILVVQLAFAQVAQLGGVVSFPSVTDKLDDLVKSGKDGKNGFFPYPLKVKFQ